MASSTRPYRHLCCFSHRLRHRLVRLDPTGSPEPSCGSIPPARGHLFLSASPPSPSSSSRRYLLRGLGHSGKIESRQPANPWLIGFKAFIFGMAWFALITLVFVPHPGLAPWIPLAVGSIWALLGFILVRYCLSSAGLERHPSLRAFLRSHTGVYVTSDISAAGWTRVDLIAKFVFQICGTVADAVAGTKSLAARSGEPMCPVS